MGERKTRGRQRIPIRLIENKDDLLVSFSKRRVGVYKKASELSTLCGVDVGAIIFSPSGIPHSFFTPDFDSVVHGRRSAGIIPRTNICELNKRLDEVTEQLDREEKREKMLLQSPVMGWWEVPVDRLNADQVKEQIEWFQTLKGQIESRARELNNNGGGHGHGHAGSQYNYPPPLLPVPQLDQYDFGPPSLSLYGGGGNERYLYPPV